MHFHIFSLGVSSQGDIEFTCINMHIAIDPLNVERICTVSRLVHRLLFIIIRRSVDSRNFLGSRELRSRSD